MKLRTAVKVILLALVLAGVVSTKKESSAHDWPELCPPMCAK